MIKLNVGNLWTYPYLEKVIELNKSHENVKVGSLFGSISNFTPTARSSDRIPARTEAFVTDYIAKAKENNIKVRYTLNQSCIGSIQDFRGYYDDYLRNMLQLLHGVGIDEWTVISPLLAEILRNLFPDDFIEVSTIVEVSTITEAQRWGALGANGVNVSTSINRDFNRIKRIGSVLTASVLCNEACLFRCPWRRECYNLSSHDSKRSEELFGFYPFRKCNEVRIKHPEEWLRSRLVLPQWLPYYQDLAGVEWFKIAYRTHPEEVAIPLLEAYMNLYFGGNLCALWPTIANLGNTPEPRDTTFISCDKLDELAFIRKWMTGDFCSTLSCGDECQYCQTIYRSCINE